MKCYSCGVEITDENRSEEHVINNALGGHLTSNDLLCKPCNDAFGHGIDAEIEGQIGYVTDLLGIKKHRENKNKRVRIEMVSATGEVKIVGKKMRPLHELFTLTASPGPARNRCSNARGNWTAYPNNWAGALDDIDDRLFRVYE